MVLDIVFDCSSFSQMQLNVYRWQLHSYLYRLFFSSSTRFRGKKTLITQKHNFIPGPYFSQALFPALGVSMIKYISVMLNLTEKSQSAVKFTQYRVWRVTFYLLILFDIFISPRSCIKHAVLKVRINLRTTGKAR